MPVSCPETVKPSRMVRSKLSVAVRSVALGAAIVRDGQAWLKVQLVAVGAQASTPLFSAVTVKFSFALPPG